MKNMNMTCDMCLIIDIDRFGWDCNDSDSVPLLFRSALVP